MTVQQGSSVYEDQVSQRHISPSPGPVQTKLYSDVDNLMRSATFFMDSQATFFRDSQADVRNFWRITTRSNYTDLQKLDIHGDMGDILYIFKYLLNVQWSTVSGIKTVPWSLHLCWWFLVTIDLLVGCAPNVLASWCHTDKYDLLSQLLSFGL